MTFGRCVCSLLREPTLCCLFRKGSLVTQLDGEYPLSDQLCSVLLRDEPEMQRGSPLHTLYYRQA